MKMRPAILRAACVALTCLAAAAVAQTGGPERLALTLEEAIRLGLSKSRTAIFARLGREEQALTLEAAEERYDPMAGSLSLGTNAASRGDETADVSIGPSLRIPTGGTFSLSWRKPLAGERDREASTSPLLLATAAQGVRTGYRHLGASETRGCRSASTSAVSGTALPASSDRSFRPTGAC